MSYVNRQTIKSLLNIAPDEIFDKKTIDYVFRSILEPLVEENVESVVFLRILNQEGLESIIKRLEFNTNCSIHNFDYIKSNDFKTCEFVMVSSSRYNAILVWDYSDEDDKNKSKIYVSLNSDNINEAIKLLKNKIDDNILEEFNKYKPERRTNRVLNSAVLKIIKNLNENVLENSFNAQEINQNNEIEVFKNKNNDDKKLRASCHEIKNQLSIIDIYTKILLKKNVDEKTVEIIRNATNFIANEIQSIRGIEKEEDFEQISISEILKNLKNITEEILKENHNKLIYKIDSKKDYFYANKEKFLGILINIVKNANESTKNDEIVINVVEENNLCTIIIENHGEKIKEEIKDKIFNEGFSTKNNGWGVGLSICKKNIEKQFGTLELAKSDETSTQFKITIPFI
ncbi:MAG: HAMP domain-containing histidine kinase [Cyanobacteria bacterium SIG30]|nr:HAMP domain-containing histidine kinase [Cyanobacteria bacterium SIG30]